MERNTLRKEIEAYLLHLNETEQYDENFDCSLWTDNPFTNDVPVTMCTSSAMLVAVKFGGMVYGYEIYCEKFKSILEPHEIENLIGYMDGGHDFCVIDNMIIDYWAKYVDKPEQRIIIDLMDDADLLYFQTHYLPQNYWEPLPMWKLKKEDD